MKCKKCGEDKYVLPASHLGTVKVYACSNEQCDEATHTDCQICNEEHALFDAFVNDSGTWNHYLLCANCIQMLKHSDTPVRY